MRWSELNSTQLNSTQLSAGVNTSSPRSWSTPTPPARWRPSHRSPVLDFQRKQASAKPPRALLARVSSPDACCTLACDAVCTCLSARTDRRSLLWRARAQLECVRDLPQPGRARRRQRRGVVAAAAAAVNIPCGPTPTRAARAGASRSACPGRRWRQWRWWRRGHCSGARHAAWGGCSRPSETARTPDYGCCRPSVVLARAYMQT